MNPRFEHRWRRGLALVLLLMIATGGAWQWYRRSSSAAVEALFAQSLLDLQGQPHTLEQWRGQPILVNFWASWCAPCRTEMPELDQLAQQTQGRLQIVGVAWDDLPAVRSYLQQAPVHYPLRVLPPGAQTSALLRKLGNLPAGLPFSVLIDANLQIRLLVVGKLSPAQVLASLPPHTEGFR
ncbi:TlpA disulfide reductase family protein [Uliginosibacterium gangwonense]|uniref:TlpA disulfide reductase family protein n=1 Tax=Uliginosibacterium gangwonense TaxID=392736 RepID=UPI0003641F02|nr:TlpA disulfide reductase family protein [Uliginosibacterium gangwonense]